MPTFNLVLGQDVCAYGYAEIEAESFEAAVQIAKDHTSRLDFVNPTREGFNIWDNVSDVEWDTATRCRIVSIENEETGETRDDIELDAPQLLKRTVWSLVHDSDSGTECFLFASEAERDARCLMHMAAAWSEDGRTDPMPTDWREAWDILSQDADWWISTDEHEVTFP